jgi:hypothetical protein
MTKLELKGGYNEIPVPQGGVQHIFASGRQLPSLQHLTIETLHIDSFIGTVCLDGADIGRISSCCPRLQRLQITNSFAVRKGGLSALVQLPGTCTSLSVGGAALCNHAAHVLVQLTQLRALHWTRSPDLTDVGLECLTKLDLDQLHVTEGSGLSDEMWTTTYGRRVDLISDPQLVSPGMQAATSDMHVDTALHACTDQCLDASRQQQPVSAIIAISE